MGLMNGIIDGTVTSGLIVYCVGMTPILGCLAWVTHVDRRATTSNAGSEYSTVGLKLESLRFALGEMSKSPATQLAPAALVPKTERRGSLFAKPRAIAPLHKSRITYPRHLGSALHVADLSSPLN
jgi:hypothetical protein